MLISILIIGKLFQRNIEKKFISYNLFPSHPINGSDLKSTIFQNRPKWVFLKKLKMYRISSSFSKQTLTYRNPFY